MDPRKLAEYYITMGVSAEQAAQAISWMKKVDTETSKYIRMIALACDVTIKSIGPCILRPPCPMEHIYD